MKNLIIFTSVAVIIIGMIFLVHDFGKNENIAKDQKYALVLLHGWGSKGTRMMKRTKNIREYLSRDLKNTISFFAPNAPHETGINSYIWFGTKNPAQTNKDLEDSKKFIENYIKKEVVEKNNIPFENIILAGFSQGASIAVYAGTKFEKPIAGIISFSGSPLLIENILQTPPLLIIHGQDDQNITVENAFSMNQYYSQQGLQTTMRIIQDIGHTINNEALKEASKYISQTFQ